jgi:hypothetical protein
MAENTQMGLMEVQRMLATGGNGDEEGSVG